MMKESLCHLRVLNLIMKTCYDAVEHSGEVEIAECRNCLPSYPLHDFIKAAPNLDNLLIAFGFFIANGRLN